MATSILLLCISVASQIGSARALLTPIRALPNPNDTFIAFVTQWVPEACYKNSAPNCNSDAITTNVTIHGLWPDFYDSSSYPSYCTDQQLNESDISSIQQYMEALWPTYSSSSTDFEFWSHEWEKHGTCWFSQTATSYFQQALTYLETYTIEKALYNGGVLPGTTNTYGFVQNALKEAFGVETVISCNGKYISGFQICVNWSGAPINCPSVLQTNCGDNDPDIILTAGDQ